MSTLPVPNRYMTLRRVLIGYLVRLADGRDAIMLGHHNETDQSLLRILFGHSEHDEYVSNDEFVRLIATPLEMARAYATSGAVREAVHKQAS